MIYDCNLTPGLEEYKCDQKKKKTTENKNQIEIYHECYVTDTYTYNVLYK